MITSLDVVIPVYNEQNDLAQAVRRLHTYLSTSVPYSFRITIANNASTDRTAESADELAVLYAVVGVLNLTQKGRGRALKAAWSGSSSSVLAYMDADLSTDLAALLPLIAPLLTGHSDLAIGSRLARGSRVVRGAKAGVDLSFLQSDSAADAVRPLLRCPMRFQGNSRRRRQATAPPRAG